MADWKTRGYVPDSDDDEDDFPLVKPARRDEADNIKAQTVEAASITDHNINSSANPATSHLDASAQTTIQQLEKALSHGLQTVRDVLGTKSSPTRISSFDEDLTGDDSPLSSAPPSLPGSPLKTLVPSIQQRETTDHIDGIHLDLTEDHAFTVPRRNLRARAPIQQHPYAIEDAQYRQLMKARGLKPVHVAPASRAPEHEKVNDESQATNEYQTSQLEESFGIDGLSYPSSPPSVHEHQDTEEPAVVTGPAEDNYDDDLLDLSEILRRRTTTTKKRYRGQNRATKLIQDSADEATRIPNVFDLPETDDHTVRGYSGSQHFQVPPSPPDSDGYLVTDDLDGDEGDIVVDTRRRRTLDTPGLLPTPLISSDNGNRKRSVSVVTDPESSSSSSAEDVSVSAASAPSGETDSQGFRWIKHALKGCLPESFLKLDMQAQTQRKSAKRSGMPLATPSGNERGVARRSKITQSSKLISRDDFQLLESDSEKSDGPSYVKPAIVNINVASTRTPLVVTDDDDDIMVDDIVEEDTVDRMISYDRPRQRQRQSRIHDGLPVVSRRKKDYMARARLDGILPSHGKTRRMYEIPPKRRKIRHRYQPVVMNVSDAPGFHEVAKAAQPQFLRIAARRAQKTTLSYDHRSPPKKFFQLATLDDTQDVNDQMIAWGKRRDIRKSTSAVNISVTKRAVDHRKIAHESSTRRVSAPGSTTAHAQAPTELANLKKSTRALLSRFPDLDSSSSSKKVVYDVVPTSVTTGEEEPRKKAVHLKSLFTHRNRSGRGSLLSRPPQPRPAQLEVESSMLKPSARIPIKPIVKSNRKAYIAPANQNGERGIGNQLRTVDETVPTTGVLGRDHSNIAQKHRRKPRKRMPTRSAASATQNTPPAPMDQIAGATSNNSLDPNPNQIQEPTQGVHETKRTIQTVLHAVHVLQPAPRHKVFGTDSVVGKKHLEIIQQKFENTYDPLAPLRRTSLIETPISQKKNECGQLNLNELSTITTVLDETYSAFFELELGTLPKKTWYEECCASLASIVHYLEISAYFYSTSEIENFCRETMKRVLRFVTRAVDRRFDNNEVTRSTFLQALDWMAIIAIYLHKLAATSSIESRLCEQTGDLCHSIIDCIFQKVYQKNTLMESLISIQKLYDDTEPWNQRICFAEADSVVVVWYLYGTVFGDRVATKQFYEKLKSFLAVSDTTSADTQLESCLLALCFTLPLTKMSEPNDFCPPSYSTNDVHGTCFSLLASHVDNVVKKLNSGTASRTVGQLLEAVVDISLRIVKIWKWRPSPTIITALWKAYAWNIWLPFHNMREADAIFQDLIRPSYEISYAPDNDFHKYLELIESCMNGLGEPEAEAVQGTYASNPGKLRGLVFSLVPNNAWSFHARDPVLKEKLLSFKNFFALLITIYRCAPEGFQPRLRDMKYHVDFSTSHSLACRLALAAWKSITLLYVQRKYSSAGIIEASGEWISSMFRQSVAYLELPEDDPLYDPTEAASRLEDLLKTFTHVVRNCDDISQVQNLVSADTSALLKKLLTVPSERQTDDDILIAGVEFLNVYLTKVHANSVANRLVLEGHLSMLRNIMQYTLSNRREHRPELITILMDTWFLIAQIMVQASHKHWSDFMEPHSNLSIDFLSGMSQHYTVHEVKQIFYSKLIEADKDVVFLEYRPVVFTTWMATLLLPVQLMRFDPILTNTILNKERESLMIKDLARSLFPNKDNAQLTVRSLADVRIVILRHIIQNVHGQQSCAEEEWLAGGLDHKALIELLRTMLSTMKSYWLLLKNFPVAQSDYTTLIHAILNELETYTVRNFKIDPWFAGASEFPRPVQTLDNVFKCRFGESRDDVNQEAIHSLIRVYTQAWKLDRPEAFFSEFFRVFHCVDPLRARSINGVMQYSIDIPKQAKFMQLVLPAFVECSSRHPRSTMTVPLFELLIRLTEGIPFRIDNLNPENINHHFATTAATLYATRKFLEQTRLRHVATAKALAYTRTAMSSIFSLVEYGISIEEAVYESCMGNILGIYSLVTEYLRPLLDRQDGVYGLSSDLDLVPEGMAWLAPPEATEPELNVREKELRAFAVNELRTRLDVNVDADVHGPELDIDTTELRKKLVEREMWGLVADLKERKFMDSEDEDGDGVWDLEERI